MEKMSEIVFFSFTFQQTCTEQEEVCDHPKEILSSFFYLRRNPYHLFRFEPITFQQQTIFVRNDFINGFYSIIFMYICWLLQNRFMNA